MLPCGVIKNVCIILNPATPATQQLSILLYNVYTSAVAALCKFLLCCIVTNAQRLIVDHSEPSFLPYKIWQNGLFSLEISGPKVPRNLLRYQHIEATRTNVVRSSKLDLLSEPRTDTTLGLRHFSVSWPRIWNELPHDIRKCYTLPVFKCHFQTFHFRHDMDKWHRSLRRSSAASDEIATLILIFPTLYLPIHPVAGPKILKKVRKTIYQLRSHLSQMHTTKIICPLHEKAAFWRRKNLSQ